MAIYSGFTMIYPLKMVIFHSYVNLPEGIFWKVSMKYGNLYGNLEDVIVNEC